MSLYVSPEQQMRDRAEFARKGVSRGRAVVAMVCAEGILLLADNPSASLRKLSEIYDRIALGAVGRYHEFEALRVMGIRSADLKGYSYDRADVTARSLAGQYSQMLGGVFANGAEKPYEVELVLAEVGETVSDDLLFHISYDGTISEHRDVIAIGQRSERVRQASPDEQPATFADAATLIANALSEDTDTMWEATVLRRESPRHRRFERISEDQLASWLA